VAVVGVEETVTVVVDGNNVMGTVPDGWWRDRPAAVRRLVARLRCYAEATGRPVEVVLDVRQADLAEGAGAGVVVRYATRRGRDAADDRIVELIDERGPGGDAVEVITSDRALAERAGRRGARVTGAATFLRRLEEAGC
jgi:predicted RNA-binding protein with PIN domain